MTGGVLAREMVSSGSRARRTCPGPAPERGRGAITALGRGFLAHRANQSLRESLRNQTLTAQDYYRQLLRLVYRLFFLFVAEDRDLLLDPNADPDARERYTRFYSTDRLRRMAGRFYGTRHADLYYGLRFVMEKLGSEKSCPELSLPALGSFLFSKEAIRDLEDCEIANHNLLNAVRALAFTTDGQRRRPVDYKNLGSEELGSVYESLLELHPMFNMDAGTFELQTASGHERKTTGSYYTPTSLITCLLDSALDPILESMDRIDKINRQDLRALRRDRPIQRLSLWLSMGRRLVCRFCLEENQSSSLSHYRRGIPQDRAQSLQHRTLDAGEDPAVGPAVSILSLAPCLPRRFPDTSLG